MTPIAPAARSGDGRTGPRWPIASGPARPISGVPVIAGGVEASLRRLAHYDYWSDKVRRSIILDAKADLLVYGMGERPLLEIVARLAAGQPVAQLRDIRGTAYRLGASESIPPWRDAHPAGGEDGGDTAVCPAMKRFAPTRGRLSP